MQDELALPEDLDSERVLISTCCAPGATGGTVVDDLVSSLDPVVFHHPAHRHVWVALRGLVAQGEEVNFITLCAWLEANGTLGRVGGKADLSDLLSGEEVGRPEVLANRLRDLYSRRQAMRFAGNLMRLAADPSVPIPDLEDSLKNQAGTFGSVSHPRSRLDVLTWKDFRGKDVPLIEWDWEPFFPKVSFGALSSHPGHGKSILMTQIGVAKAAGLPLFGFPTGAPGGVGILGLEDEPNVFHRRVAAAVESYGEDWTPEHDELLQANLRILVQPKHAMAELTPAAFDFRLTSLMQDLGRALGSTQAPPSLLFLDTLNAVHEGDENSSQEARPLIAAIRSLHAALGCSVWALHHFRKTGSGKTAPALLDRMDPELLRGTSAILGGVRAVNQLGWILPNEAAKVDLDVQNSTRRYAILGLTKVNDGASSSWLLLEHSNRAGLWVPVRNGDMILARLRGGNAAAELTKAEAILLDIHKGMEHDGLREKHWPGDPKSSEALKAALANMRRRNKWLQSGSLALTVKGLERVQELGRQATECDNPGGGEDEYLPTSA